MKNKIIWLSGILGIVLISFFVSINLDKKINNEKNTTIKNESGDIKQLVHDYSVGNLKNGSASITSQQLIVTDKNSNQVTYDLPKDEFFVSIAPYIHQTHPCEIHSLTGCRGEMANEEFHVYIENTEGNIIVDKKMKTYANGFIDLWLPRNETFTITITKDEKSAQSEISTFEDDQTCVTNMKL